MGKIRMSASRTAVATVAACFLVTACQTTNDSADQAVFSVSYPNPLVVPAADFDPPGRFWEPPSATWNCEYSTAEALPFELSKTLTRAPHPKDYGWNFLDHVGLGLLNTMAGKDVTAFKDELLAIAQAETFTEVDLWASKWSPIYIQSSLLRTLAVYITYMESKGLMTPAERSILVDWGNTMIDGQMGRTMNGSADSRAASGVALMSWGSLNGDVQLMELGYRNYNQSLPYVLGSIDNLKRQSMHLDATLSELSLYDEYNAALEHAIEGAVILENLGVDAFSASYKGKTLHDAVDWWASVIVARPKELKSYARKGHVKHLGWIPIYLSKHADRPVAGKLYGVAYKLGFAKPRPIFRAISLGGATDCLWGFS